MYEDRTRANRDGSKMLPMILETAGSPDVVILMLGTNDCKTVYGASAEEIGEGVRRLIRQVHTYAAGSRILLMAPIHLGERVWEEAFDPEFGRDSLLVSRQLGRVYSEVARQEHTLFCNAADYAVPSNTDREHLSPEGHRRLAEAVYEKLQMLGL